MEYHSKLLSRLVGEISKLPGIGERTALRLALHLLKQPQSQSLQLAKALTDFRTQIKHCRICYNISDTDTCSICANPMRDHQTICVVETVRDVMAVENTGQFNGVYHVLGGVISPMEGISPNDLFIQPLIERIQREHPNEVIFALSPTVEGDTTGYYIYKEIKDLDIKISTIARGVSFGEEIEYADEMTLARSIENRIPFDQSLKF